mgnify:CR=1 FL=1
MFTGLIEELGRVTAIAQYIYLLERRGASRATLDFWDRYARRFPGVTTARANLALEAAQRLWRSYAHGAFLVPLESAAGPQFVVSAIAAAIPSVTPATVMPTRNGIFGEEGPFLSLGPRLRLSEKHTVWLSAWPMRLRSANARYLNRAGQRVREPLVFITLLLIPNSTNVNAQQ